MRSDAGPRARAKNAGCFRAAVKVTLVLAACVIPCASAQTIRPLPPPEAVTGRSPLDPLRPILTASSLLTLEGNAAPGQSTSAGSALLDPPVDEVPPPFWLARQTTGAWLPLIGSNGFGMTDVEVNTTIVAWYHDGEPIMLVTPGFGFHSWIGQDQLDLPPRVFDAYLDINWRIPWSDRWTFNLGVTPGVYGDFESFDSSAFQVTGWGLAIWTWSPVLSLLGGVAVVRQLESHILPIGGVVWTPNEDTRFEIFIPRPRIARRMSASERHEVWGYIAGEFGGGAWSVTLNANESELLIYNDLRLLAGVEWLVADRLTGVAEVGYVFAREIFAFGILQATPSDTLMLRASLAF